MHEHHYPQSFEDYLQSAYPNGGMVNDVFEERVYHLVRVVSRIADLFATEKIPYQVIGGLAVFAHVQDVAPDEERTTKDVDIMVNREDLERIKSSATEYGFRFRHT